MDELITNLNRLAEMEDIPEGKLEQEGRLSFYQDPEPGDTSDYAQTYIKANELIWSNLVVDGHINYGAVDRLRAAGYRFRITDGDSFGPLCCCIYHPNGRVYSFG